MDKNKQIKEMARIAHGIDIEMFDETDVKNAVDEGLLDTLLNLYNAGYRKSSEVAREIFEELARIGSTSYGDIRLNPWEFAELKKKYEVK